MLRPRTIKVLATDLHCGLRADDSTQALMQEICLGSTPSCVATHRCVVPSPCDLCVMQRWYSRPAIFRGRVTLQCHGTMQLTHIALSTFCILIAVKRRYLEVTCRLLHPIVTYTRKLYFYFIRLYIIYKVKVINLRFPNHFSHDIMREKT